MCIYCTTRSLVTRCVSDDEIGKCFSAIAVFSSLVPLVSSPAFRLLYNATLSSFPAAFLWMCACVMLLPAANNVYLFTQRSRLQGHGHRQVDEEGGVLSQGLRLPSGDGGDGQTLHERERRGDEDGGDLKC